MSNISISVSHLVHSGLAGNFISLSLVSELSIPVAKLPIPITFQVLDGRPYMHSPITHITILVQLSFHNHSEYIQFYVLTKTHSPLGLGLPWLQMHNPQFTWITAKIITWSPKCVRTCKPQSLPILSILVESPLAHTPIHILPEYVSLDV